MLPNPVHLAYKIVASNPPVGYSFVPELHSVMEQSSNIGVQQGSGLFYKENRFTGGIIFLRDCFLLTRERLASLRRPSEVSLVFSLSKYTAFNRVPTILYTEYVSPQAASRRAIQRTLYLQRSIKKILASSRTSIATYLSVLTEKEVEEKVDSFMIGVPLPPPFQKQEKETVNLLFVSSGNYQQNESYAHAAFTIRGGMDVLRSFRLLNKQYGNKIRLVMRSYIPRVVKENFADVLGLPNVSVYEQFVPKSELRALYESSDIMLFPAYRGVALTIGEAFGYGLPVVGADSWDMPDYVTDKFDGLLPHRDDTGKLTIRNHVPFWDFENIIRGLSDDDFLKSYVEAVSTLIDQKRTRQELAANAIETVRAGGLSIPYMRKRLGQFFEEAIAR